MHPLQQRNSDDVISNRW